MTVRSIYRCTKCNNVSAQWLYGNEGKPDELASLGCGVCRSTATIQKLIPSQSLTFHGDETENAFHHTKEPDANLVVVIDPSDKKRGYPQQIVLDQNDAIRLAAFLDFELMREEVE